MTEKLIKRQKDWRGGGGISVVFDTDCFLKLVTKGLKPNLKPKPGLRLKLNWRMGPKKFSNQYKIQTLKLKIAFQAKKNFPILLV